MSSSPVAGGNNNNSTSNRKRKYSGTITGRAAGGKHNQRNNANWKNPKRGGPGMLLTCETGRESKCRREGLEILNYYYSLSAPAAKVGNDDGVSQNVKSSTLNLEEELKLLKSKTSSPESTAFGVYDTGCRGTVFVLCTLPNCQLIKPIKTEYKLAREATESGDQSTEDSTNKKENENDQGTVSKKVATEVDSKQQLSPVNESDTKEQSSDQEPPLWDPISTFESIRRDRTTTNTKAPCSRFVTRMIPIQATCFASEEELRLTSTELLQKYLPKDAKTFAIVSKRRNCQKLKTDQIIDTIATVVLKLVPGCKVQLENPHISIVVEICQTLCGISIVENAVEYRNFNLFL